MEAGDALTLPGRERTKMIKDNASAAPSTAEEIGMIEALATAALALGRRETVELLDTQNDVTIVAVLRMINPSVAQDVLDAFEPVRRQHIIAAAAPEVRQQWTVNETYPDGSIGRMMEPPIGLFRKDTTVTQAIEQLKQLVKKAFITYGFIVDDNNQLIGVLVFRDLLVADHNATLEDVMYRNPFSLSPGMPLMEAMKAVLNMHFPVYPVCENGQLVGLVRGRNMFEKQAIELSAQAGTMVGVDKEERLSTPWPRSLKFRHPWLQLNLLTAFVAAAVVGVFQGTIDRIVILAVFLPVLAGQSGNTGCQSLAVALRAMTLGELNVGRGRAAVIKEALLGFCNGMLVGLTAGVGMYFYARSQEMENPMTLAMIVLLAMTGACILSGVCGVLVPLALKRVGADPATASSIFLTTATDVASMGLFLGLATVLA